MVVSTKKAADQGDGAAQIAVGMMYEFGKGVPKDYSQAFEWFKKVADQGNADAQNIIGMMYENGKGVDQDKSAAVEYYEKAARGNHYAKDALQRLGVVIPEGTSSDYNAKVTALPAKIDSNTTTPSSDATLPFQYLAADINSKMGIAGVALEKMDINVNTGDFKEVIDSPAWTTPSGIPLSESVITQWWSASDVDLQSIKVEKRNDLRGISYYCVDYAAINKENKFTEQVGSGGTYYRGGEFAALEYISTEANANAIAKMFRDFISYRQKQPKPSVTEADQVWKNSSDGQFASEPFDQQKQWFDGEMNIAMSSEFQNRMLDWAAQQYAKAGLAFDRDKLRNEWMQSCRMYAESGPSELHEVGGAKQAFEQEIKGNLGLWGAKPDESSDATTNPK